MELCSGRLGRQNVGAYHGLELVYVFNDPNSFITHYLMGLPLVGGKSGLTILCPADECMIKD